MQNDKKAIENILIKNRIYIAIIAIMIIIVRRIINIVSILSPYINYTMKGWLKLDENISCCCR